MCSGRIELIIGSMFSGKSTEVIRLVKRYKVLKKNILTINHSLDNRYGESIISTHDKEELKCLSLDKLIPIMEKEIYLKSDVIFVEEGQFFKDLYEFATKSADFNNKIVIISGLDGDFQRNPFGDILRLIPHAEIVKKLNALCVLCCDGTLANFTQRIVDDDSQQLVGSQESYRPVCRKHYHLK